MKISLACFVWVFSFVVLHFLILQLLQGLRNWPFPPKTLILPVKRMISFTAMLLKIVRSSQASAPKTTLYWVMCQQWVTAWPFAVVQNTARWLTWRITLVMGWRVTTAINAESATPRLERRLGHNWLSSSEMRWTEEVRMEIDRNRQVYNGPGRLKSIAEILSFF